MKISSSHRTRLEALQQARTNLLEEGEADDCVVICQGPPRCDKSGQSAAQMNECQFCVKVYRDDRRPSADILAAMEQTH